MTKYSNTIEYRLQTSVDLSGLNKLQTSLAKVQTSFTKMNFNQFNPQNNLKFFDQAISRSQDLQKALSSAFSTSINGFNPSKVLGSINQIYGSISKFHAEMKNAGASGVSAFNSIVGSIGKLNTALRMTSSLTDKIFNTIGNTVRWGIISGIFESMRNEIGRAVQYVQSLDRSLNDIRIVSGQSAEQMREFAIEANRAAQNLGKTTTAFTDASLIFVQQGYDTQKASQLAGLTLKTANVTGQSTSEVSEQLTALINGYQLQGASIEYVEQQVDKLAKVAAVGAADLEELATGFSKVSAVANTLGVSTDQLTAQLSTIISVTREAPEAVGNALKTIYSRLGDLKLGETLEDGTTLGRISQNMEKVGVEVLDATGKMRDMGTIIEDLMKKWKTLSTAQKQGAAIALAGRYQYTRFMALLENSEMYYDQLNESLKSAGTLEEQQAIYLDSMEAKMNSLKAAGEGLINSLFDPESIKPTLDSITDLINNVQNFIDIIGGGQTVLLGFSSILGKIFSTNIAAGMTNLISNMHNASIAAATSRNFAAQDLTKMGLNNIESESGQKLVDVAVTQRQYSKVMTKEQAEAANVSLQRLVEATNKAEISSDNLRKKIDLYTIRLQAAQGSTVEFGTDIIMLNDDLTITDNGFIKATADIGNLQTAFKKMNNIDFSSYTSTLEAFELELGQAKGAFDKFLLSVNSGGSGQKSIGFRGPKLTAIQNMLGGITNSVTGEAYLPMTQKQHDAFESLKQDLTKFSHMNDTQLRQSQEKVNEVFAKAVMLVTELKGAYGDMTKVSSSGFQNMAQEASDAAQAQQEQLEQFREKEAEQERLAFQGMGQAVVNYISNLGMLLTAFSSIKNMVKTLTDDSIDSGEKVSRTLENIGFLLPMVIMSIGGIVSSMKKLSEFSKSEKLKNFFLNAQKEIIAANVQGKHFNIEQMSGFKKLTFTIRQTYQTLRQESTASTNIAATGFSKLRAAGTAAFTGLKVGALSLGRAISAALPIIGWATLVISVVAEIASAIMSSQDQMKENQKEANQKLIETGEKTVETIKQVNEARSAYVDLYAQWEKDKVVTDELKDAMVNYASVLGGVLDQEQIRTDNLKELNGQLENMLRKNAEINYANAVASLGASGEGEEKAPDKIEGQKLDNPSEKIVVRANESSKFESLLTQAGITFNKESAAASYFGQGGTGYYYYLAIPEDDSRYTMLKNGFHTLGSGQQYVNHEDFDYAEWDRMYPKEGQAVPEIPSYIDVMRSTTIPGIINNIKKELGIDKDIYDPKTGKIDLSKLEEWQQYEFIIRYKQAIASAIAEATMAANSSASSQEEKQKAKKRLEELQELNKKVDDSSAKRLSEGYRADINSMMESAITLAGTETETFSYLAHIDALLASEEDYITTMLSEQERIGYYADALMANKNLGITDASEAYILAGEHVRGETYSDSSVISNYGQINRSSQRRLSFFELRNRASQQYGDSIGGRTYSATYSDVFGSSKNGQQDIGAIIRYILEQGQEKGITDLDWLLQYIGENLSIINEMSKALASNGRASFDARQRIFRSISNDFSVYNRHSQHRELMAQAVQTINQQDAASFVAIDQAKNEEYAQEIYDKIMNDTLDLTDEARARILELFVKQGRKFDVDKAIAAESLGLNDLYENEALDDTFKDTVFTLAKAQYDKEIGRGSSISVGRVAAQQTVDVIGSLYGLISRSMGTEEADAFLSSLTKIEDLDYSDLTSLYAQLNSGIVSIETVISDLKDGKIFGVEHPELIQDRFIQTRLANLKEQDTTGQFNETDVLETILKEVEQLSSLKNFTDEQKQEILSVWSENPTLDINDAISAYYNGILDLFVKVDKDTRESLKKFVQNSELDIQKVGPDGEILHVSSERVLNLLENIFKDDEEGFSQVVDYLSSYSGVINWSDLLALFNDRGSKVTAADFIDNVLDRSEGNGKGRYSTYESYSNARNKVRELSTTGVNIDFDALEDFIVGISGTADGYAAFLNGLSTAGIDLTKTTTEDLQRMYFSHQQLEFGVDFSQDRSFANLPNDIYNQMMDLVIAQAKKDGENFDANKAFDWMDSIYQQLNELTGGDSYLMSLIAGKVDNISDLKLLLEQAAEKDISALELAYGTVTKSIVGDGFDIQVAEEVVAWQSKKEADQRRKGITPKLSASDAAKIAAQYGLGVEWLEQNYEENMTKTSEQFEKIIREQVLGIAENAGIGFSRDILRANSELENVYWTAFEGAIARGEEASGAAKKAGAVTSMLQTQIVSNNLGNSSDTIYSIASKGLEQAEHLNTFLGKQGKEITSDQFEAFSSLVGENWNDLDYVNKQWEDFASTLEYFGNASTETMTNVAILRRNLVLTGVDTEAADSAVAALALGIKELGLTTEETDHLISQLVSTGNYQILQSATDILSLFKLNPEQYGNTAARAVAVMTVDYNLDKDEMEKQAKELYKVATETFDKIPPSMWPSLTTLIDFTVDPNNKNKTPAEQLQEYLEETFDEETVAKLTVEYTALSKRDTALSNAGVQVYGIDNYIKLMASFGATIEDVVEPSFFDLYDATASAEEMLYRAATAALNLGETFKGLDRQTGYNLTSMAQREIAYYTGFDSPKDSPLYQDYLNRYSYDQFIKENGGIASIPSFDEYVNQVVGERINETSRLLRGGGFTENQRQRITAIAAQDVSIDSSVLNSLLQEAVEAGVATEYYTVALETFSDQIKDGGDGILELAQGMSNVSSILWYVESSVRNSLATGIAQYARALVDASNGQMSMEEAVEQASKAAMEAGTSLAGYSQEFQRQLVSLVNTGNNANWMQDLKALADMHLSEQVLSAISPFVNWDSSDWQTNVELLSSTFADVQKSFDSVSSSVQTTLFESVVSLAARMHALDPSKEFKDVLKEAFGLVQNNISRFTDLGYSSEASSAIIENISGRVLDANRTEPVLDAFSKIMENNKYSEEVALIMSKGWEFNTQTWGNGFIHAGDVLQGALDLIPEEDKAEVAARLSEIITDKSTDTFIQQQTALAGMAVNQERRRRLNYSNFDVSQALQYIEDAGGYNAETGEYDQEWLDILFESADVPDSVMPRLIAYNKEWSDSFKNLDTTAQVTLTNIASGMEELLGESPAAGIMNNIINTMDEMGLNASQQQNVAKTLESLVTSKNEEGIREFGRMTTRARTEGIEGQAYEYMVLHTDFNDTEKSEKEIIDESVELGHKVQEVLNKYPAHIVTQLDMSYSVEELERQASVIAAKESKEYQQKKEEMEAAGRNVSDLDSYINQATRLGVSAMQALADYDYTKTLEENMFDLEKQIYKTNTAFELLSNTAQFKLRGAMYQLETQYGFTREDAAEAGNNFAVSLLRSGMSTEQQDQIIADVTADPRSLSVATNLLDEALKGADSDFAFAILSQLPRIMKENNFDAEAAETFATGYSEELKHALRRVPKSMWKDALDAIDLQYPEKWDEQIAEFIKKAVEENQEDLEVNIKARIEFEQEDLKTNKTQEDMLSDVLSKYSTKEVVERGGFTWEEAADLVDQYGEAIGRLLVKEGDVYKLREDYGDQLESAQYREIKNLEQIIGLQTDLSAQSDSIADYYRGYPESPYNNYILGLSKWNAQLEEQPEKAAEILERMANSFDSLFIRIENGWDSANQSWQDYLNSIPAGADALMLYIDEIGQGFSVLRETFSSGKIGIDEYARGVQSAYNAMLKMRQRTSDISKVAEDTERATEEFQNEEEAVEDVSAAVEKTTDNMKNMLDLGTEAIELFTENYDLLEQMFNDDWTLANPLEDWDISQIDFFDQLREKLNEMAHISDEKANSIYAEVAAKAQVSVEQAKAFIENTEEATALSLDQLERLHSATAEVLSEESQNSVQRAATAIQSFIVATVNLISSVDSSIEGTAEEGEELTIPITTSGKGVEGMVDGALHVKGFKLRVHGSGGSQGINTGNMYASQLGYTRTGETKTVDGKLYSQWQDENGSIANIGDTGGWFEDTQEGYDHWVATQNMLNAINGMNNRRSDYGGRSGIGSIPPTYSDDGSGGSGGGGGNEYEPKAMEPIEEEKDLYERINVLLGDIQKDLDLIADEQDRLVGDKLTANINKQIKLTEKQIEYEREKLDIMKEEAEVVKKRLADEAGAQSEYNYENRQFVEIAGIGVTPQYDEEGFLTNYAEMFDAHLARINSYIAAYNMATTEEEQNYIQLQIDLAKEAFDSFKTDYKRYDDLLSSEMNEQRNQIEKLKDSIEDLRIEAFKTSIEAIEDLEDLSEKIIEFNAIFTGLDSSDSFRKASTEVQKLKRYLDSTSKSAKQYWKEMIDGAEAAAEAAKTDDEKQAALARADVYRAAQARAAADADKFGRTGTGILDVNKYIMEVLNENLAQYLTTGVSDIFGENAADLYDMIDQVAQKARDDMADVEKYVESLLSDIKSQISDFGKEVEDRIDLYANINKELDHLLTISQMLHGENYGEQTMIYQAQGDNYKGMLAAAQEAIPLLESTLKGLDKYIEVTRVDADGNVITMKEINPLWESANEELEKMYEQERSAAQSLITIQKNIRDANANQALDDMMSSIGLQAITYDENGNRISYMPKHNVTRYNPDTQQWEVAEEEFGDLEWANKQWELINRNADQYLDDVNRSVEVQKLQNRYQEMLNDSIDPGIQRQITEQMEEQMKFLREKTQLSQYDVEYANAQLDILQKRIALEEAQRNKSQLKLRRDAQGNYSYVYTANQDDIANAENDLLDAELNAYNLAKNHSIEVQGNSLAALQQFREQVFAIMTQDNLTAEEQKNRIQFLAQNLREFMEGNWEQLSTSTQQAFIEAMELANMVSDVNQTEILTNFEYAKDASSELLSSIDERFNSSVTSWVLDNDRFNQSVADAIESMGSILDEYEANLDEISQKVCEDFDNMTTAVSNTAQATAHLNEEQKTFHDILNDQSGLTQGYIDALATITSHIADNRNAMTAYKDKVEELNNALIAKGEENAALSAALQALNSRNSGNNAAGGNAANGSGGSGSGGSGSAGANGLYANGTRYSNEELIEGIAGNIWSHGSWGNDPNRHADLAARFGAEMAVAIQNFVNLGMDALQHDWITGYYQNFGIDAFDTGGYTGEWDGDGRIAMLHQKELVLNKQDTENMLDAVKTLRDMQYSSMSAAAANFGTFRNNLYASLGNPAATQDVHIEATFPGVQTAIEIEQALLSLTDRASQYMWDDQKRRTI